MKQTVLSILVIAASLSGCSSNSQYFQNEPRESFGQFVGQFVVDSVFKSIKNHHDVKSCNKRSSRRLKSGGYCSSRAVQARTDRADAVREAKQEAENLERKEAVNSAYANRHSINDTANIIERHKAKNEWIKNSEQSNKSVIVIDKPTDWE